MTQVSTRTLIMAVLGFVFAGVVQADAPKITAIRPAGVQRGVPTEVVITGTNLTGQPRWLGSFGALVRTVGPATDPAAWRVQVLVDPDVPTGVYLIRVQTEGGLSDPMPFAVDQVPHLAEVEENSSFDRAQSVPTPVVVEGQASGADVDYFRFRGVRGEQIILDAACARVGSGVDPTIRLSTFDRRFIAAAEDSPGLATDARLCAELPIDGDYVIELSDTRFQGAGPRTNYRLLIGRGLAAAGSIFPLGGRRGDQVAVELTGGTLPTATPHRASVLLAPPLEGEPGRIAARILEDDSESNPVGSGGWTLGRDVEGVPSLAAGGALEYREPTDRAAPPVRAGIPAVFNGQIEAARDTDAFVVTGVTPGQKVRVALEAAGSGSLLDGLIQVQGTNGAVLATNDDSTLAAGIRSRVAPKPNDPKKPILSLDPEAIVTIPAGTTEITATVRDLDGAGGPGYPYRLLVEPVVPGFDLLVTSASQVNIPRGGTTAVSVEADRRDFAGPIELRAAHLPPGVTSRSGLIPAGQTTGHLTLSAAAGATFDPVAVRIMGVATGPTGPIEAEATKTTVLASQADFATSYRTQTGLLAGPAAPPPITLTTPAAPVEVVLAYAATIPVRAVRMPGAEDVVLTFAALPTVPNLAIAPDPKLTAKATEGTITVNTNADLPAGSVVIVPTARGRFGDRERTIILPAVTLSVVRPAEIELAGARVEIAAGGSAEVRGKVSRRGNFRDPVTVKIDALPAGLTAEAVVVSPEATDFALKLTAAAQTAPTEAAARVVATLKLGPRDYAPPAVPLAIKVNPTP